MVRLKVIESFVDKYTKEVYVVGKILNMDDADRISDLIERGLVISLEVVEEKAAKPAPKPRKKKKEL